MLEVEALIELLVEKGIVSKDELMAKFKKLNREINKGGEFFLKSPRYAYIVTGLCRRKIGGDAPLLRCQAGDVSPPTPGDSGNGYLWPLGAGETP